MGISIDVESRSTWGLQKAKSNEIGRPLAAIERKIRKVKEKKRGKRAKATKIESRRDQERLKKGIRESKV
jgi:hypothetical protein